MMDAWKNRIIGTDTIPAGQLIANPGNFRIHPKQQQAALAGSLDTLGWIDTVLVNKSTGFVVDGHARVTEALRRGEQTPVPVLYVELTPEEEAQALLSLDPIAAMAATDREKLDGLMRQVQSDDARVQEFIETLAVKEGLAPPVDFDAEWQGMPEFEQPSAKAEKTLLVHFACMKDYDEFIRLIGQENISEKTRFIWYPEKEREIAKDTRWSDES